jgi:pimeloyl-ACP methyl ester carboxylesterase
MKNIISFTINLIGKFHLNLASKWSYFFFSTPFKGRLSAQKLPTILTKAKIDNHQIDNLKYTSYTWQKGVKSVLLIHGWESNSSRWEALILKFISFDFTVHAIDAPAHGLSGGKRFNVFDHAKCIADYQLKNQIPFVIGHSIGGTSVMYHLTHTEQQFIKKVVILGAPSEFKSLIENYANTLKLNNRIYMRLIDFLNQKYKYPVLDFSIAEFCKTLDIEGKIFHDESDDVIAINEGQLISRKWKTSDFEITQGLGHSMHNNELNDKILFFMNQ